MVLPQKDAKIWPESNNDRRYIVMVASLFSDSWFFSKFFFHNVYQIWLVFTSIYFVFIGNRLRILISHSCSLSAGCQDVEALNQLAANWNIPMITRFSPLSMIEFDWLFILVVPYNSNLLTKLSYNFFQLGNPGLWFSAITCGGQSEIHDTADDVILCY